MAEWNTGRVEHELDSWDYFWDREKLREEVEWWSWYAELMEAGLTHEEKIEKARGVLRQLAGLNGPSDMSGEWEGIEGLSGN